MRRGPSPRDSEDDIKAWMPESKRWMKKKGLSASNSHVTLDLGDMPDLDGSPFLTLL
jgi:hypothetical protein